LNNLAEKPSKKSNTIAARISHEAVSRYPFAAKIIAINPEARLRDVKKFGMCFMKITLIPVNKEFKIRIIFSR